MTFFLPEMILAEIEAKFLFLNALDYYFALLLKVSIRPNPVFEFHI